MPVDTPTLGGLIGEAIAHALIDVHTAMPGTVEAYDAETKLADIRPALRRVLHTEDEERVAEELPIIPAVPVAFPSAGPWVLKFPIPVGSTGLLLFSEYGIDQWRASALDGDPGDTRRHGLAGAVFLPGLRTRAGAISDANPDALVIGRDDGFLLAVTSSDEIELPQGSSQFLARADRVLSELSSIASALVSHVHTAGTFANGAGAVTGVSGPSNSAYSASDPAADQVRGT